MKPDPKSTSAEPSGQWHLRLFFTLLGAFLGLTLLKFGDPPIMEKFVAVPRDIYEFLIWSPWPIAWAHWLLIPILLLGVVVARWKITVPWWLAGLPLAWLLWQFVAASQSSDPALSRSVVVHFTICVACFYLGLFSLRQARGLGWFWFGFTPAFLLVLAIGWQQHFGGLEATRRHHYALMYVYPQVQTVPQPELEKLASNPQYQNAITSLYPQLKEVPPDVLLALAAASNPAFLEKLNSTRIASTLFYPNTLAGALLLFLPPLLAATARLSLFTVPARVFLIAAIGLAGLACLYWSGSKAGWLLMLVLGILVLLRLPYGKQYKAALITAVLLVGLAGFFWHHAHFFRKGATSVSARFDYWQAAMVTTRDHPLFGSGPGTFGSAYSRVKRPESEPTRLTHNDYLEQASDSGLPAFLAYGAFIIGALAWSARGLRLAETSRFAVWLGVLGWSLQSLLEFGLYIPALAWAAFALLGWLLGSSQDARKPVVHEHG